MNTLYRFLAPINGILCGLGGWAIYNLGGFWAWLIFMPFALVASAGSVFIIGDIRDALR